MNHYKTTKFGIFFAVFLFLFSVVFEFDLFEMLMEVLHEFEHFEIDEAVIPIFIILLSYLLDILNYKKSHKIETEKLKIYKAMLNSTHHILNNFLNKMMLVKHTIEEQDSFPKDIKHVFDNSITEASKEIESLGSVTEINDKVIEDSVYPK